MATPIFGLSSRFILFLLLPAFSLAQSGEIRITDTLSAGGNSSPWLSPSEDFAFGFRSVNGSDSSSSSLYLLCIWYARIPEQTIVWYAKDDKGGSLAPAGSVVQLTATSGIVLRSPQASELWRSEQLRGEVGSASMTDAGNFVIHGSSNSSPVWETFWHPTDTILPSQSLDSSVIPPSQSLNGSVLLSSRRAETDFSNGRFRLVLLYGSDLVLNTVNLPTDNMNYPYYIAGAGSSTSPPKQLVFDESGILYVVRDNGSENFNLTENAPPSPNGGFYHRVVLSFDGVLTQYYHPKSGNGSWTHLWNQPHNICMMMRTPIGSGTCGFNNICYLESEGRPRCECPAGYSLMDPNDPYGNCRANYTQSCEDHDEDGGGGVPLEELYGFEEIQNTDWPTSDYALLEPFTENECRHSCLNDCMCAAAIFRTGDLCWKKKLPLSNGRLDIGLNGKALLKVRKANPKQTVKFWEKKNRGSTIVVVSVLLGFSAFVNVVFVIVDCFGFPFISRKNKKKQKKSPPSSGEGMVEPNLLCFTYEDLEDATNGFEEELGRGAFGIVYKGELQNGVLVAVKKLNSFGQESGKEFRNEVTAIGQTHHKNLVRLIGYCDDGNDCKLLVYEYLSNGTLAEYLFQDSNPSWGDRILMALGIARGLLYLHEECSTQVIHCDIKPQNILLDDRNSPRISDFGLAKLIGLDQSQTQTAIRGTKGYVAPEWFRSSPVTAKVDVYSFGVLLLEIVCCRRNVDNAKECSPERAVLTYWAYDCYCNGAIGDLVEHEVEAMSDGDKLEKYVMIAIWCIQEDPSVRPTMKQVWQMLDGVADVSVPPCPTPYSLTIT